MLETVDTKDIVGETVQAMVEPKLKLTAFLSYLKSRSSMKMSLSSEVGGGKGERRIGGLPCEHSSNGADFTFEHGLHITAMHHCQVGDLLSQQT